EESKQVLLEQLKTNTEDQYWVIDAIGDSKCTEAIVPLRRMYDKKGTENRANLLKALLKLAPADAEELILGALADSDETVVAAALEVAAEQKLTQAIAAIRKLLKSSDGYIRDAAQRALDALNPPA